MEIVEIMLWVIADSHKMIEYSNGDIDKIVKRIRFYSFDFNGSHLWFNRLFIAHQLSELL